MCGETGHLATRCQFTNQYTYLAGELGGKIYGCWKTILTWNTKLSSDELKKDKEAEAKEFGKWIDEFHPVCAGESTAGDYLEDTY